ncbi:hypothetical protein FRC20_005373, partial [Serendipita sp. 405]
MNNFEAHYALVGAIAIATSAYIYLASRTTEAKAKRAGARLAPGPKRLFLLGNLLDFPKDRWFETFTSWGKQYGGTLCFINVLIYNGGLSFSSGDVVYLNLAGVPMIILSSLEAAEDLVSKRAAVYSGRPYARMVLDLMASGYSLVFIPQGHEFNEQRKLFRLSLGPQVLGSYDRLIQQTIEGFVGKISGFKGDPHPRITRSISTIITKITYGEQFYKEHGEA